MESSFLVHKLPEQKPHASKGQLENRCLGRKPPTNLNAKDPDFRDLCHSYTTAPSIISSALFFWRSRHDAQRWSGHGAFGTYQPSFDRSDIKAGNLNLNNC